MLLVLECDLFLCLFTSWSSGSRVLLADLLRDLERDLDLLSCRDLDFPDLDLDLDLDFFRERDRLSLRDLDLRDLLLLLLRLRLRLRLLDCSLTSSNFLPFRSYPWYLLTTLSRSSEVASSTRPSLLLSV